MAGTVALSAYWANTSSNSLMGKLVREGSKDIKITMEDLLNGGAGGFGRPLYHYLQP